MNALDYQRLAEQHRPGDETALAREVRKQASAGLTERDIGMALRLDPGAVRRLLAADGNEARELHARAWKVTT